MENHIQNEELDQNQAKKAWVTPKIEIISQDIESGTVYHNEGFFKISTDPTQYNHWNS